MGLFSRKKAEPETQEETTPQVTKDHGPWEASEVEMPDERHDFGALRIPQVPGGKVQFSINPATREALGVVIQIGASQMQLNLYAAPTSAPLWADIREEIVESAKEVGGSASYREGPFGPEVESRLPRPEVKEMRHVRYVGVDGYRWFLRATIEGEAVTNKDARKVFDEIIKDTVVDRGSEPHPSRDLILMTMPEAAKAQLEAKLGKPKRPKRGPEIAEIR